MRHVKIIIPSTSIFILDVNTSVLYPPREDREKSIINEGLLWTNPSLLFFFTVWPQFKYQHTDKFTHLI